MKYADNLKEIINAFKMGPLEGEELSRFYYGETMQYRTGDRYSSPIYDISDACKIPSERNAFLLMGHRGCGKSTELNKMSSNLRREGYCVANIECAQDLDLNNIVYTDLLILLGETLLKIAEEIHCKLDSKLRKSIAHFWNTEITKTTTIEHSKGLSAEGGAGVEAPAPLSVLLSLFAKIKGDLKYSEEKRTEYKTRLSAHISEWIQMINLIADQVTEKLDAKQPVVIFEDLDKINGNNAWEVFGNYSALLTSVSFPIIYTFPIAMSYDPRFSAVEGYFLPKTLPMLKQETIDGKPYQEGTDVIIEIVKKRAALKLFEKGVLETLIRKTGGSLRDLFHGINTAAQRAIRRDSETISNEDIERALEELKSSLTRRIEEKQYAFLARICKGERKQISDKQMLLEMLQANTVLEYNGERWHNVHPLIADFLEEQGLLEK